MGNGLSKGNIPLDALSRPSTIFFLTNRWISVFGLQLWVFVFIKEISSSIVIMFGFFVLTTCDFCHLAPKRPQVFLIQAIFHNYFLIPINQRFPSLE